MLSNRKTVFEKESISMIWIGLLMVIGGIGVTVFKIVVDSEHHTWFIWVLVWISRAFAVFTMVFFLYEALRELSLRRRKS
jgi:hypothetical protein